MSKRFSDYLRAGIINHLRGAAALAQPVALYVSLHTGDPGGAGANEVVGGGYARKLITFDPPVGGVSAGSEVVFEDMPPVTVSGVGLWDAAVGGNFLMGGEQNPKAVPAGDDFVFDAADLSMDLT